MKENESPEHVIAVGIGGTGAKCIEALAHIAVSGHAPQSIYPILIDQDSKNGNVQRCKNVLQAYAHLYKNIQGNRKWFFKSSIELWDELLPLKPQEKNKNYSAAIGLSSMNENESLVVKALFLPCQLNESLDSGYKKRAHMGSLLVQQMLEFENKKSEKDIGLKFIISKVKNIANLQIIVYGSLFGGTGASGLVRVGKYFKNYLPNAKVKGVFLTPYFMIGKSSEDNNDSSLVKSDADMQAVKIALQIYKNEIADSFDKVYVLGSELSKLDSEYVTEEAKYGGEQQINPANVYEFIAALIAISNNPSTGTDKIASFVAETEQKEISSFRFSVDPNYQKITHNEFNAVLSGLGLSTEKIIIAKDFANMLYKVKDHNEKSWWRRQLWFDAEFKSDLLIWGIRHYEWWKEMSPEMWENHLWKKFSLVLDNQIEEYSFSSVISKHFPKSPTDLSNLFKTIDSLTSSNFRR